MKELLNLWINYKQQHIELLKKYRRLSFEYFVFERITLIESLQIKYKDLDRVIDKFPQYFNQTTK